MFIERQRRVEVSLLAVSCKMFVDQLHL